MAIQIDEKLLSPLAKEALRNAKSKSKLLRDALEAYVRMDLQAVSGSNVSENNLEMFNYIKEIRNIVLDLSQNKVSSCEIIPEPAKEAIKETAAAREEEKDNIDDSISEEEKRKIEELYDSSLIGFGDGDDE